MREVPSLINFRSKADQAKGRRDAVDLALRETRSEIHRLSDEEELLDLVAGLFRTLIDREVTTGVQAVERLQTEGLQAVFPDQNLKVRANVDVQRGKVSVDLLTQQVLPSGESIEGLSTDSFGGSVLTVQSILLRIIVMLRRGLRPILLLDEALPAFDENYIGNFASFLTVLCQKLNIDILVITHNQALFEAATHSYRIVKKGDEGWFERVR